jgi:uncharacterized protein YjbI with pentapeptide repeats
MGGRRPIVPSRFEEQAMSILQRFQSWPEFAVMMLLSSALFAEDGADFKYKVLSDDRFDGQKLIAADFSYSVIAAASFDKAILRKAMIKYAVASDAKFTGADLQGALLRYSVMTDARFTGADCRRADFSYSLLADADFTGADLRGAIFTHASLGGRFDASTTYDNATKFPEGFDPVAAGLTLRE